MCIDALKPLHLPTIKPLSDTSWDTLPYDVIHALRKDYQAVLKVLKAMSDDNDEQLRSKK